MIKTYAINDDIFLSEITEEILNSESFLKRSVYEKVLAFKKQIGAEKVEMYQSKSGSIIKFYFYPFFDDTIIDTISNDIDDVIEASDGETIYCGFACNDHLRHNVK